MSDKKTSLDKVFTFGAVVILFTVFSITATNFFTVRNLLTMALQTSTITLMGIGVTYVIITAGIDLSIGSILGLSSVVLAMQLRAGVPPLAAVAGTLGIAEARGDATPEDKRAAISALQAEGSVVAMVGDGINDAPSLAQAQVSICLGSATPLAQWTADVVVLSDKLARIADTVGHARRTMLVVRENLAWAFVYNMVAIPAAAFGHMTPLFAALGMSVSSLLVVGNALRVSVLRDAVPAGRHVAGAS